MFNFFSMLSIFLFLGLHSHAANLKNTSCIWVASGGGYFQASATVSLGFQNGGDRDYNISNTPMMINEIPGPHQDLSISSMVLDMLSGSQIRPNCNIEITAAESSAPGKSTFNISISKCNAQNFLVEDPLQFTCELSVGGG